MEYIILGLMFFVQFAIPFAVCWLFQNWLGSNSRYLLVKLLPMAALVVLLFVVICNEMTFNSFFFLINTVSGLAGVMIASVVRLFRKN